MNDDYGRSFAVVQGRSRKSAFTPWWRRTSSGETTDFRIHLNELRRARPDIVFYVGTTPEGALILRQAEEQGLTRTINFIGAEEMSEMELLELAGPEAVEGTYAIGTVGPGRRSSLQPGSGSGSMRRCTTGSFTATTR